MAGIERRRFPRKTFYCEARVEGLGAGRAACRIADISLGGAFVEGLSVLPAGARTQVCFTILGREVSARAEVRYSQPGIGMGLRFLALSEVDLATLRTFLVTQASCPAG